MAIRAAASKAESLLFGLLKSRVMFPIIMLAVSTAKGTNACKQLDVEEALGKLCGGDETPRSRKNYPLGWRCARNRHQHFIPVVRPTPAALH